MRDALGFAGHDGPAVPVHFGRPSRNSLAGEGIYCGKPIERVGEAVQARYAILREIIANPPTTHSGAVMVAGICAAMIEIDTQGKEPSYPWERGILAAVARFRRNPVK